jgi:DNA-binding beta-propeller fold protein YncE
MRSMKNGLQVVSPFAVAVFAAGTSIANGCTYRAVGDSSPSASAIAPDPFPGSPACGPGGCVSDEDAGVSPGAISRRVGLAPSFGALVTASTPPPPISGGTLLVSHDGHTVIAADPDRDAVYVADTTARSLTHTIGLQPGDEPGRLAEDAAGRVHVALRTGGALVTIDPSTGTMVSRRAVCPAPRGVAFDAANDFVWVACATGELVAFPTAGGPAARSFVVERDMRDVLVQSDGSLTVSLFRSATLLHIASDGTVSGRNILSSANGPWPNFDVAAHVAWRTIAGPAGGTITSYQVESLTNIDAQTPGGYSGLGAGASPEQSSPSAFAAGFPEVSSDGGASDDDASPPPPPLPMTPPLPAPVVESVVGWTNRIGTTTAATTILEAVLPVDVALSPDGTTVAVAAAGDGLSVLGTVYTIVQGTFASSTAVGNTVIAVAYDGSGDLIAQTREPATLVFATAPNKAPIVLSNTSRADSGFDIFHTQAGGLLACASCHPEGGDDGNLWSIDGMPRRTPSLRGTIAGTAPYHWLGDETTMGVLIDDVYTHRMSGVRLAARQKEVLSSWVQAIPAPPAPSWVDQSAVSRGQALFQGSAGCAACHSGAKFTNSQTVDVGTADPGFLADGGTSSAFQVPPLVGVGWRTPLMHNGCAATIADRFGACSTAGHGTIAQLASQNISDLTAYLESL